MQNARRPPAAQSRLAENPDYRQALAAYRRGDRKTAHARLTVLLRDASLSPADRRFLERQQTLCRSHSPQKTASIPTLARSAAASNADCGPKALRLVCRRLNHDADLAALRRDAATTDNGTTLAGLARAAQKQGLSVTGVQMDAPALATLKSPAAVWMDGNHYVALLTVQTRLWDGQTVAVVHDPNKNKQEEMELPALLSRSGGILLTVDRPPTQRKKT